MANILLKKLEDLVNQALLLDESSKKELAKLSGKIITFEFINTDTVIYVVPENDRISLKDEVYDKADVRIRGTPASMFAFMMATRADEESYTGSLEIIGDIDLGQRFQNVIKNMDIDWEEQLSYWLGDTLAHKFGNIFRDMKEFIVNTRKTLALDVSEYLRYEKEILPDKSEVDEYTHSVDKLRNDVERLKFRIDRLQQSTQTSI